MKKIILIFILFFLNIYSVNACFTSVSFSNVHNRTWGHQNQCRPLGSYSGSGSSSCFTYSTSNSSIVKIGSSNGKLCFYSVGHGRATATITVSGSCMCDGKEVTRTISFTLSEWGLDTLGVEEDYEISPSFSDKDKEYTLTVPGKQKEITIVAKPNNARSTITGAGKKQLQVGENAFTISVKTPENVTTTYKLTVTREKPKEIEEIYFADKNLEYDIKTSSKLVPIIRPSDALVEDLVWASSDSNVVTVNNQGNVNAVGVGNATVTVTTKNGLTASVDIKVIKHVNSILLKESIIYMGLGEKRRIEYDIYPEDATNRNVSFISDNPNVVSVDKNGNIKPQGYGKANVTVTTEDGGYKGNCIVVIDKEVQNNIGNTNICNNKDMLTVIGVIKKIILILQIIIPIALVLFGSIDMFKAVVAQDEKAIKDAQGILLKRFIYAVLVFLVFILVRLIMSIVGSQEWRDCWDNADSNSKITTR